jgi:hypothetical protein
VRHHRIEIDRAHALADRAFHAQQADAVLVLHQLADRAHPAIAEMVDVVDLAAAVLELDQQLDHGQDVLLAKHANRVLALEPEARVHLHAADGGQVVTLGIEEQVGKHRLRRVDRRRLAGPHDPVDVHQGLFARPVLVDGHRIADVGADIDMIDRQRRDRLDAGLAQGFEGFLGQLVAGLDVDRAGLLVDDVGGDVAAQEIGVLDELVLEALLDQLAPEARRHLFALFRHDLAVLGIDQIGHQLGAPETIGIERCLPAAGLDAGVIYGVIEVIEYIVDVHAVDLFERHDRALGRELGPALLGVGRIERQQQCRHRQLAAAIDADVDEILGVELEIEPRAAIGNDAGGEQELARRMGLALVVVEENAGRAVHLRDDDALGAVDDEGAVIGHQGHVAHVDVLLLDVADRARAGLLVDVEDDEAERHLERRGEGHAALLAFVDVVFRRLELVLDEFERAVLGEILDRKDRLEDLLKTVIDPIPGRFMDLQERIVGALLHLDQVGHRGHLADTPEFLANTLSTRERLGHRHLSDNRNFSTPRRACAGRARS